VTAVATTQSARARGLGRSSLVREQLAADRHAAGRTVDAVDTFWAAARAAAPALAVATGYQVRWIGLDDDSTRAIFELMRAGDKTGTFTLHWIPELTDQPRPAVGDCIVLIDFHGRPTLLVRRTRVHSTTFGAVTAADVAVDGSPVRALEVWKPLHTVYWNGMLAPFGRAVSDEMGFWVERFDVLYDADRAA
jgi:uncharacterized protein YhfF